jgi:hypothetical protein
VKDQEVRDKVTVGLTPGGAERLERVLEGGWFQSDLDAYRAAIIVALGKGIVSDGDRMTGVKTKFNVGSLDPDGRLRDLVELLAIEPAARTFEYAERCADAGLEYMAGKLSNGKTLFSEVLLSTEDLARVPEKVAQA